MKPKTTLKLLPLICCFFFFQSTAQNGFFRDAAEGTFSRLQKRVIIPSKYRTISLDKLGMSEFIGRVPAEAAFTNRSFAPVIELPMPSGEIARFRIWESTVMEPGLAQKFPDIKTFTGQGIDDPLSTIKLDWTPAGFHAMILSP